MHLFVNIPQRSNKRCILSWLVAAGRRQIKSTLNRPRSASVLVLGRKADGGRFSLLSSSCDPNVLFLKPPPSLCRPYPPTSTMVKRYLASHVAIRTMERAPFIIKEVTPGMRRCLDADMLPDEASNAVWEVPEPPKIRCYRCPLAGGGTG